MVRPAQFKKIVVTVRMHRLLVEALRKQDPDYPMPELIMPKQIAQALWFNGGYFAGNSFSFYPIRDVLGNFTEWAWKRRF